MKNNYYERLLGALRSCDRKEMEEVIKEIKENVPNKEYRHFMTDGTGWLKELDNLLEQHESKEEAIKDMQVRLDKFTNVNDKTKKIMNLDFDLGPMNDNCVLDKETLLEISSEVDRIEKELGTNIPEEFSVTEEVNGVCEKIRKSDAKKEEEEDSISNKIIKVGGVVLGLALLGGGLYWAYKNKGKVTAL